MLRLLTRVLIVVFFILTAAVVAANYVVVNNTRGQIYTDLRTIPKNKVGLLLGTAKYNDKGKNIVNQYYHNRIEAAVALYMAGKIDYIIVSGDSGPFYNEPQIMKDDLVANGVPANRIYMDNAGYRTLDSILRCRDVFGQRKFTIISQKFHNERALYLANHKDVSAIAYDAADGDTYWDVAIREKLARVKMMLDLFSNKQAKYYGEPIQIR